MMNKGMATVWIILLTVAVTLGLGAGYILYTQQLSKPPVTTPSGQPTTPPSSPAPSIPPTRTEQLFTLIGQKPYSNNTELYQGYVIVEGSYSLYHPYYVARQPETLGAGDLRFTVNETYRSKMPKAFGENVTSFIFDNKDLATVLLVGLDRSLYNDQTICQLSGSAKIALSGFEVTLTESAIPHFATLAGVFSTTKPSVEKFSDNCQ